MEGLSHLKHCLDIDVDGPGGNRATNTAEPKKWRVTCQTAGRDNKMTKLFLVGMNERREREVEIECVAVSKKDLKRCSEQSYGWSVIQLSKSWITQPGGRAPPSPHV